MNLQSTDNQTINITAVYDRPSVSNLVCESVNVIAGSAGAFKINKNCDSSVDNVKSDNFNDGNLIKIYLMERQPTAWRDSF